MKPKRLSLPEAWNLYRTLQAGMGKQKEYLIDELFDILDKINKEDFLQSLLILYPKIEFVQHNPVEMATLFIAGLKHNNFFAFADVVEGLKRGNPDR